MAAIGRHFADVRLIELPGTIVVHEPDPIIAHLTSYQAWADTVGVPFEAALGRVCQLLAAILDRDGEFRVSARSGIIIGTARS